MFVYHVVTERPMYVGQKIVFDESHRSGVYTRVHAKLDIVNDIYAHPENYDAETLEHHTSVAMRELALEEVRLQKFPDVPSRMGSLYVSRSLEESVSWGEFFARIGRPTYHIVKLEVKGPHFIGNANNCFRASLDKAENLRLAEIYWSYNADDPKEGDVIEMLVSGDIEVVEIVKEINANI